MATKEEKAYKAATVAAAQQAVASDRSRARGASKGTLASPRMRAAGDMNRYLIGGFADDPTATVKPPPTVKPPAPRPAPKPGIKPAATRPPAPQPKGIPAGRVKPKPAPRPIGRTTGKVKPPAPKKRPPARQGGSIYGSKAL
jgi:hypothetical protein